MLFSSLLFLSIFLPAVLLVYYSVSPKSRNSVLLVASLIFYGWGEPRLLAVMLLFILANYATALLVESAGSPACRRFFLILGLLADFSVLGYFKYADFFIENINRMTGCSFELLHIVLPLGISFYTFQAVSYLIDVYRKEVCAEKNIAALALFITFFPQLIAGPIIKYHEIADQFKERTESLDGVYYGLSRFILGLTKKVLIANIVADYADQVYALSAADVSCPDAWLGAVAYAFQIYFDFSGYSDMAIGLGMMFGFRIPENFNFPYISKTITEFWRRWHISLSTWFREYLYFPLGGSRCSRLRSCCNLLIVFAATGIWHGASWTFVIWGLWHGFFIVVERIFDLHKKSFVWPVRILMHVVTLLIVLIGWVFFRIDDLPAALDFVRKMVLFRDPGELTVVPSALTLTVLAIAVLCSTELVAKLRQLMLKWKYGQLILRGMDVMFLVLVMLRLVASSYNPFIYFRF